MHPKSPKLHVPIPTQNTSNIIEGILLQERPPGARLITLGRHALTRDNSRLHVLTACFVILNDGKRLLCDPLDAAAHSKKTRSQAGLPLHLSMTYPNPLLAALCKNPFASCYAKTSHSHGKNLVANKCKQAKIGKP